MYFSLPLNNLKPINYNKMLAELDIYRDTSRLESRYKKLVEKAYNFKYTNSSISDLAAYKAMRLLEKINRIKFGY